MNCCKSSTTCVLETCAKGELLPWQRPALLGGKFKKRKRGPKQKNQRVSYHVSTQPLLNVLHDRGLWDRNLGRAAKMEKQDQKHTQKYGPRMRQEKKKREREEGTKEREKRRNKKQKQKTNIGCVRCIAVVKLKKKVHCCHRTGGRNRTEKSTRTNKAVRKRGNVASKTQHRKGYDE